MNFRSADQASDGAADGRDAEGMGRRGDDNKKMTTVLTTYDDEATALFSLSPFPCFSLRYEGDPLGSGCADSRPDDFVQERGAPSVATASVCATCR